MTSALDLLMDSDSTAETTRLLESNGICTIDSRTRTIFVPPEIIVGAVQSDKNAERIKFSCPKIVGDNLDLSKFSIRINFENVSIVDPDISIKDQYICEDASINGDNITFSWVIGKNAARYMGTTRFIVCAVKTDSDSNISIEWNTTVAQIPVLEGIEVDQPSLDENNKDIINQLLAITKTASDEAVKNVNSAKEQAITEIQNVLQPDKTLTVEGGIADAKATGNAISSLREDIIEYQSYKTIDVSNAEKKIQYTDGHTEKDDNARLYILKLKKGESLYVKAKLYSSQQCIVFECKSDGTFVKSILVGNDSTHDYEEFTTVATHDIYYGICGYYSSKSTIEIKIVNANIGQANIGDILEYNFGMREINAEYTREILYKNGFYTEPNYNAVFSSPILVKAGECIYTQLYLYSDIQVALAICDSAGKIKKGIGYGLGKYSLYSFLAEEDTYVRVCSLREIKALYIKKEKNIYHVGANREYKSFIDCIKSLQGDESEKYIYVDAGEYDLFSELGGKEYALNIASGTNWEECNVLVPDNTHIIGIGNVVFTFTPSASEIGNVADKLLSPINPLGNFYMENITIISENCRYCVHDDVSKNLYCGNSLHEYKNVKLKKTYNNGIGLSQAFGGGIGNNQRIILKDCVITASVNACSFHDNGVEPKGTILVENCAIYGASWRGLSFTNTSVTSKGHIDVKVINTYLDKNIFLGSETGAKVDNSFDITAIKSGNVERDENISNKYPALVFN